MKMLRTTICAVALCLTPPALADLIDVSFGGTVASGSPSVYTLSNSFTLPTGFTNASLTIGSMYGDDRGVLALNGTIISNAGIFGPGAGSMTLFPAGPNDPFTFTFGNGVQNLVITSGFQEGLNTLNLIVNDTNNGIFGTPLETGVNISGANVVATVSFDAVPVNLSFTANLEVGYNLIGNSFNTTLNVVSIFGNQDVPVAGITPNIVTVWKWNAVAGRWAFYSPQFTVAGIAAYAAARGYEVLATINPGEGYWVNAITPMSLPAQAGTAFDWDGLNFAALPAGFKLITHANTATPSQFNMGVNATVPPSGVVPTGNFLSLWAWDAAEAKWYFYSPLLESTGGLPAVKSYADSQFFRHFQDFGKMLGAGVGFWVNRP